MAAAGEAGGGNLTEAELPANAVNVLANPLAVAQHQRITRSGITPGATGVEFDFTTVRATPTAQSLYRCRHAGMIDGKSLIFEAGHALMGLAVQAPFRHGHLSLNWITTAAFRVLTLI